VQLPLWVNAYKGLKQNHIKAHFSNFSRLFDLGRHLWLASHNKSKINSQGWPR
jgi:hypothetical protein